MSDYGARMAGAKDAAAELGIDKPDSMETSYRMTNKYFYDLRYGEEDKKRKAEKAAMSADGEEGHADAGQTLPEAAEMQTAPPAKAPDADMETAVSAPRDITVITNEILFYKVQAGRAFLEIGRRLNEAKAQLSHGEWLPWLREKVDISERSAQRFMQLSNEYGKSAKMADLGASKALQLLALPESEREEFAAEKHTVDGQEKTVEEMTSKELENAIRERDAALTAQKQAEDALSDAQKKADAAKAERDALSVKSDGLEEKLRRVKEREKAAKTAAEQAKEAKAAAEKELAELKAKPVEVAVAEPSQETLDKLRADAEAAVSQKVQQAEERLEAEKKKAEDAAAEADALRKRLSIADPLTTEFQVYFNGWQKAFMTMTAALEKIADEEKREKLRRAIRAAAERMVG